MNALNNKKRHKLSPEIQAILDEAEGDESNNDAKFERFLGDNEVMRERNIEDDEPVEKEGEIKPDEHVPDAPEPAGQGEIYEIKPHLIEESPILQKRIKYNRRKRRVMLKRAGRKMHKTTSIITEIKKRLFNFKAANETKANDKNKEIESKVSNERKIFTDIVKKQGALDAEQHEGYAKIKEKGFNPVTDPGQLEEYIEHEHEFEYEKTEKQNKANDKKRSKRLSGLKARMAMLMYAPRFSLSNVVQDSLREQVEARKIVELEKTQEKKLNHVEALKHEPERQLTR